MSRRRTALASVLLVALMMGPACSSADRVAEAQPPPVADPALSTGSARFLSSRFTDAMARDFKFARDTNKSIENTGPEVYASDYRWQVALQIFFPPGWRCGGILINSSYILTAAHCLDAAPVNDFARKIPIKFNQLSVTYGADRFGAGQKLELDTDWGVAFHDDWKQTGQPFAWDAALLKLKKPLTGAVYAPIRSVAFTSGDAVVSGWGDYDISGQASPTLRAVKLPVVSNEACRTDLKDQAVNIGAFTLCAASPQDQACARDSGGPLVIGTTAQPQTIGVVSWGPPGKCGAPGAAGKLVGAYARGSEIAAWVLNRTKDASTVTDRAPGKLFDVKPRNDI